LSTVSPLTGMPSSDVTVGVTVTSFDRSS
jgi:hypothetical protein